MRPLRLRARNLRTFPDLDLTFDHGVVGILGELRDAPEGADSNGAGKSTLLEAIDIALFGRRSLAGYLTRGGDVDELMVELTFEHAGETYRVRRTYSARGRGSTKVDLEVQLVHNTEEDVYTWEPLTRASAKETDEKLCSIIGLSRDTFRDSAYLRQGDGGFADPTRDPRQRKQLFIEAVLGSDPVWPKLADIAKTRRKDAEALIERHRGDHDRLAQTAAGADAVTAALTAAETLVVTEQEAVTEADRVHAAVAARYQAARDQEAARGLVEAELAAAEQTLRSLLDADETADTAAQELFAADGELSTLATPDELALLEQQERDLVALLDTYTTACDAHGRAKSALDDALRRRAELHEQAGAASEEAKQLRDRAAVILAASEGTEHCEMCKQKLGAEAAQEAASTLQQKAREQQERAAALAVQENAIQLPFVGDPPAAPHIDGRDAFVALTAVRAQLAQARTDQARRATVEEKIRQLTETVASRPSADAVEEAQAAVAAKRQALAALEPVDTAHLLTEGQRARAALDAARTRHTDAVVEKARCEERLEQVVLAQTRLDAVTEAIAALQADIDRDLLLERAAGRDGIPALILENTAIPSIEAEASRILHALGTGFQVELRTQAENKTGGLRDTLDVVVIDADGNECEYETGISEGQKTRVALALRVALARLLRARGAGADMLALDEPSYLDAAGMVALLDVLREIEASGEFSLVFLVSHVAELRDSLEQTITVVQENGVSRIDGARVLEPVAA